MLSRSLRPASELRSGQRQGFFELGGAALGAGFVGLDPLGISDDRLSTLAGAIYRMRQHRQSYFDSALFAEPAWDMMLDLFINKVRGARVSTTSLCLAAGVPHATGIRWIRTLREHGLLRRYRATDDARLMLIEITPKGYQLMRRCLSEGVTRFELPVPG